MSAPQERVGCLPKILTPICLFFAEMDRGSKETDAAYTLADGLPSARAAERQGLPALHQLIVEFEKVVKKEGLDLGRTVQRAVGINSGANISPSHAALSFEFATRVGGLGLTEDGTQRQEESLHEVEGELRERAKTNRDDITQLDLQLVGDWLNDTLGKGV